MDETDIPLSKLMEESHSFTDSQELDTAQLNAIQRLQSSDEGQVESFNECGDKRSLYALRLKEFAPLTNLFRQVPLRAQHGFSTFDIRFTCLDVVEQYVCIGSNIGTVYVYNRRQQSMQKLRCEGYTSNITSVKILYSLDYLVACATESGSIFIFRVPVSELRKEIEKFHITGIHKNSITCLEWGQNGMKLFSGDAAGLVVYTEMDYLQNMTKSRDVLKEVHAVVQLSYRPRMLLVSTTHRSLFCRFDDVVTEVKQIGQKPRKCSGKFGAIFDRSETEDDVTIYASRPGLRLWKADTNGVVLETMLLRDVLVKQETNISLLNKPINPSTVSIGEMQLGKMILYQSLLLLTWNEQALFVVDPDVKMVVGSCLNLKMVVDVAVCNDEIFVLQGQRHLIRIACAPEDECSFANVLFKEPSTFMDIFSPLQELGNIFKSKTSLPDQPTSSVPLDVFTWLNNKMPPMSSSKEKQQNPSSGESEVAIPLPDDAVTDPGVIGRSGDAEVRPNENATVTTERIARWETPSSWNDADDPSDFKVYHVRKKKKGRSSSVPKGPLENIKCNSSSLTSLNDPEVKRDEVDASSCSSSLTGSTLGILGRSQDGERFELSVRHGDEDHLLDRILDIYSRSKDVSEGDEVPPTERPNPAEDGLSEKSSFSSLVDEMSSSSMQDGVVPDATRRRSYPDVVPDPEPKVVDRNPHLTRLPSEEADIYSSISPSSPDIPDPSSAVFGDDSAASDHSVAVCSARGNRLSSGEWHRHESPAGTVVCACVTSLCLYCVDSEENLWYSSIKGSKLHWKVVNNCSAHQVAVGPCGSILCVLYKGSARVTVLKMDGTPAVKWADISKDVATIALDDSAIWYVKKNGNLRLKRFDGRQMKFSKSESAKCPWVCKAVACRNDVAWALTCQGNVICRIGSSKWEEIFLSPNMWASNIALGADEIAWLIGDKGGLWFRRGITSKNPRGIDCWWQVELQLELIVNSPECSTFAPNVFMEKLSNLFVGHQTASVTSGTKGVWYCPPQSLEILASCGSVIGHCWKKENLIGIPEVLKWETFAVVDFDSEQCGIWSLYKAGELFFCTTDNMKPINVPSSEISGISCLASSFSALWVLTIDGMIHMRNGMTLDCPLGTRWELVDTNQLGDLRIMHISCSPEIAWGCLENGDVVARVGPLYSPPGLPLVWLSVDEGTSSSLPSFSKVFVGVDGLMVWAIDSGNSVYVREGIEPDFPVGTGWKPVPGLLASQLCILKWQVVALVAFSGEFYVRCGISPSTCQGASWKAIPGSLTCISASNNGMWGLGSTGQLLRHRVTRIHFENENTVHSPQKRKDSRSDEDWEMI